MDSLTDHRRDGVRDPQGLEAVPAVSAQVVRMMQEAEGDVGLDHLRSPEGMVEATPADPIS